MKHCCFDGQFESTCLLVVVVVVVVVDDDDDVVVTGEGGAPGD